MTLGIELISASKLKAVIGSRNYLLSVLLLVLAFNYVDRLALGLLLQDIKVELSMTDVQLGLLTGLVFALFYSTLGIPIARLADRSDRVKIIAVTTLVWTVMVALCGFARSFVQLALFRCGVAIGEAGCVPPAQSLISDYFDRSERPRAIAIYMSGASFSVIFGYLGAGWLNQYYGWRVTFIVLALPGLLLAPLAWGTLRDPRFKSSRLSGCPTSKDARYVSQLANEPQPRVRDVLVMLWTNSTMRHLLVAFSINSFFAYGIAQWQPAFFIRSYALETGALGTWFAIVNGPAGLVGLLLGGHLASRYAVRLESLQLKAMTMSVVGFGLLSISIYLTKNLYAAMFFLGLANLGINLSTGPTFALIHSLVAPHARATAVAVMYLVANLIGMGLGPLVVGGISDMLGARWGDESLRYSLLAMCPGYFWGAWHLWKASRTVASDLAFAQTAHSEAF